METKIDVAEILKEKPQGTKLYDLLRNIDVVLDKVHITDVGNYIECISTNEVGSTIKFDYSKLGTEGGWLDGLQILLPSKGMRDWSKFAWKKGDVLASNNGKVKVIFDKFRSDTYSSFIGKYHIDSLECNNPYYQYEGEYATGSFKLEEVDAVQTYINTIEERLGGKINRDTLEIEKAQPEFKDGDIVVYGKSVAICRKIYKHTLSFYVSLNEMFGLLFDDEVESSEEYRFATEEEKKQLFDALAKEGKAWDAEKKQIVDLKTKVELKPFDKVLVRDTEDDTWQVSLFGYKDDANFYRCNNGCAWNQCIPYFGNENLLGTTKDVEG